MHFGVSNDSIATHTRYEFALGSVVGPAAPMVDRCLAFSIEEAPMVHLGVDQPMVATFHALFHAAFQPSQGFR